MIFTLMIVAIYWFYRWSLKNACKQTGHIWFRKRHHVKCRRCGAVEATYVPGPTKRAI